MAFRLVAGENAGPAALGILLPPGTPTVLIVRPRALNWDLLLVRGAAETVFQALNREEAQAASRGFLEALQEWSKGRPGIIQPVAGQGGFQVWADIGDYCFVACERKPGQPYRPLQTTQHEAQSIAAQLTGVLKPSGQTDQEVYLNTLHFSG